MPKSFSPLWGKNITPATRCSHSKWGIFAYNNYNNAVPTPKGGLTLDTRPELCARVCYH